jgi:hypothetical protein
MPPQQQTWVRDCVLYLRKSKGKAGIARQRKEGHAYADRLRWRIVAEFVEPDTTAFARIGEDDAPRPEYEAMIEYLQRDTRTPEHWRSTAVHHGVREGRPSRRDGPVRPV